MYNACFSDFMFNVSGRNNKKLKTKSKELNKIKHQEMYFIRGVIYNLSINANPAVKKEEVEKC